LATRGLPVDSAPTTSDTSSDQRAATPARGQPPSSRDGAPGPETVPVCRTPNGPVRGPAVLREPGSRLQAEGPGARWLAPVGVRHTGRVAGHGYRPGADEGRRPALALVQLVRPRRGAPEQLARGGVQLGRQRIADAHRAAAGRGNHSCKVVTREISARRVILDFVRTKASRGAWAMSAPSPAARSASFSSAMSSRTRPRARAS